MAEGLTVTIQLASTGERLAELELQATSTIRDLRGALSASIGAEDADCKTNFLFGNLLLDESTTLAAAGIQSADVVSLVRQKLHEVEVWCLGEYGRGRGALECKKVFVPEMTAREISIAAEGCHLLQIGLEYIRMFEPDELVSGDTAQVLKVSGAGLGDVNGLYIRAGTHNGFPRWRRVLLGQFVRRWRRHGYFRESTTWLRKGSDGNWCIVNNPDGLAPRGSKKEFFYLSESSDLDAPTWKCDAQGEGDPPSVTLGTVKDLVRRRSSFFMESRGDKPHNVLFSSISRAGPALVAVPPLGDGQRPIVLHALHFTDETWIYAKVGHVDENSFGGFDDECIGLLDGSFDEGPALFQYTGK